ncbi:hypothetical protein [Chryseolinea soli]|nr:hypothetical protein [Chryseolinea soli]
MTTPSHPGRALHDPLRRILHLDVLLHRQRLVLFFAFCLHSACAQSYPETVKVLLPDKEHAELYNPTFIIRWKSAATGMLYNVTLKDLFDEELLKIETSANSIDVDWRNPKIANADALLVEVQIKGNGNSKSPPNLVKKLSTKARAVIDKLITAEPSIIKEENARGKLARAVFYEEHHLLIDALTAYEYAISLADTPEYRAAYKAFLVKNKMDDE